MPLVPSSLLNSTLAAKKDELMKKIPFDFCLELLSKKAPLTKPMFGAYGVYVDSKIVLILRERESYPQDNGVWLATTAEHHDSLKDELKSMRSIAVFGPGTTGWQNLPSDSAHFENDVEKVCELILKGDPRIGKNSQKKIAKSKKLVKASAKKALKKIPQKPKKSLASRKKGSQTSRR